MEATWGGVLETGAGLSSSAVGFEPPAVHFCERALLKGRSPNAHDPIGPGARLLTCAI